MLSGAADTVTFSPEARAAMKAAYEQQGGPRSPLVGESASQGAGEPELPTGLATADAQDDAASVGPGGAEAASSSEASEAASAGEAEELTPEEEEQVEELKRRDAEVRTHEQAHQSVGRPYTSAPTYDYQTGPDGRRYAVGGSVQIDTSPIDGDPAATIRKMEKVRASALAPAEPSGQDRKVAAEASRAMSEARAELAEANNEGAEGVAADGEAPESLQAGAGGDVRGVDDVVAQGLAMDRREGAAPTRVRATQQRRVDPELASAAGLRAYARTMAA